ncbi:phosphatidylinositol 4,5-bisphosphate 3-kinase catalytic subunit beta isoform-like [Lingula anatina]|uniref:Phosphatidylinositol 4,5-bisphosphate 3-kinase catalytic subunit beta isoform-like n=1 Tax=Lingula anatina TaxID=7574 RepID=A0A1S3I6V0_LINAN|nr:phosphatidylinositol 4,5-bisphosphate 3-kinase catalytic subunit beta isoform-like [Lingula anatina]|eukprot:XP_013393938.1 phosphatidylinositol 4,5-bisphosphate 3-kinase catalytic subunit beta isoform-like [Lingula anatina]
MGPYQLDYWSTENSNPCINVDCLLPTGLLVPLLVYKDATLEQIKQELWKEAQKLPLYGKLEGINEYLFMCINQTAEQLMKFHTRVSETQNSIQQADHFYTL